MDVLWAHLNRPPGRLFHAVVVVALAWIAAFWSYPGPNWLAALPAGYVLAAAGLAWVPRAATYGLARLVRGTPSRLEEECLSR
jgi:hypothetical protein